MTANRDPRRVNVICSGGRKVQKTEIRPLAEPLGKLVGKSPAHADDPAGVLSEPRDREHIDDDLAFVGYPAEIMTRVRGVNHFPDYPARLYFFRRRRTYDRPRGSDTLD